MAIGKSFSGVRSGVSKGGLVDVDIRPLPIVLVGQFRALAFQVKSFHEPLKRSVQTVIIPSIRKNFEAEGRPEPWEPLRRETLSRRAYEGRGAGPILQRSGRLRNAATALARWTISRDEAFAGGAWPGSAWYGPLHQSGFGEKVGLEGGIEIPARPFMLIQEEDQLPIENVFRLWFAERAKVAGF